VSIGYSNIGWVQQRECPAPIAFGRWYRCRKAQCHAADIEGGRQAGNARVAQCLQPILDQDHVGAGDHALQGGVEDFQKAIRGAVAGADRVRRVDAYRHPGQAFDHGYMGEIDQVAVRVAHVGFHTPETEHHVAVAFRGQVFGGVEGFVQGDAETAFEQHREFALATDNLTR